MIRFQITGVSAGAAKCSSEFSIPTITPDSARSSTTGEQDPRELDRQVTKLGVVVEARRDQRHDHPGHQHEQRGEPAQHDAA